MGYFDEISGTVTIRCRVCQKVISSGPYVGFTTAVCGLCHENNGIVDEAVPLEMRSPENRVDTFYEKYTETVDAIEEAITEFKETVIETTKKVGRTWKVKSKTDPKITLKKKM